MNGKSIKKSRKIKKAYLIDTDRDGINLDIMDGQILFQIEDTQTGKTKNYPIDIMNLPWQIVGDLNEFFGSRWNEIDQFIAIENTLERDYPSENYNASTKKSKDISKRQWEGDDYSPRHNEQDIENALRSESGIDFKELVKCEYVGTDWEMGSQYWIVMFKQNDTRYGDNNNNYGVITAIDWTYDSENRGIECYYGAYRLSEDEAEEIYQEKIQRESGGTRKARKSRNTMGEFKSFNSMVKSVRTKNKRKEGQ